MRRGIWIFVVISPLIALAQSGTASVPVITPGVHFAQQAVTSAKVTLAGAVHIIQTILT